MIAHFSELDGTTFQEEIPYASPEQRIAIPARISMKEVLLPDTKARWSMKRYKLVGISDDIAFYDRIVDLSDLEE